MPQQGQCERSRSLAIYKLLLELYPRAYLGRHRDELLQNFQDFSQEMPSLGAFWCFIAKDLAVSLRSAFLRTFWGQTTLVFTILGLLLRVAHRHPGQPESFIRSCFLGYALGWFAGWLGFNWRISSTSHFPSSVRSFRGQVAILTCAITILLVAAPHFPGLQERLVLAFCYGTALAWLSGWWKNRRRLSFWST